MWQTVDKKALSVDLSMVMGHTPGPLRICIFLKILTICLSLRVNHHKGHGKSVCSSQLGYPIRHTYQGIQISGIILPKFGTFPRIIKKEVFHQNLEKSTPNSVFSIFFHSVCANLARTGWHIIFQGIFVISSTISSVAAVF